MNRVRQLRQEQNWRQADLAERLHTKQQTIARYETGERGLDVPTIHKLCDLFGVSADYLLCRSDQRSPEITEEEAALIQAYRRADADAREMVNLALKKWRAAPKADSAAS